MLLRLLLLFILLPFVELALLLKLAEVTSWQHTLLLVIVTGIVGTLLAHIGQPVGIGRHNCCGA